MDDDGIDRLDAGEQQARHRPRERDEAHDLRALDLGDEGGPGRQGCDEAGHAATVESECEQGLDPSGVVGEVGRGTVHREHGRRHRVPDGDARDDDVVDRGRLDDAEAEHDGEGDPGGCPDRQDGEGPHPVDRSCPPVGREGRHQDHSEDPRRAVPGCLCALEDEAEHGADGEQLGGGPERRPQDRSLDAESHPQ